MKWWKLSAIGLMMILSVFISTSLWADSDPDVDAIVAKVERSYSKLKDLRADIKVDYANEDELRKISEDFARSFGFKKIGISFKSPDKFRYESAHVSFAKVVVVTRGFQRSVQIPSLHIRRTLNIDREDLGKKQYPIDFGIGSGDLWSDWKVQYLRTDTFEGQSCYVLKLTNPRGSRNETHMEIWIDRSLWIPRRVDKIRGNGELKSRLVFKQLKLVERAIMVPHRIEIYNVDGKLGGALEYTKVDLNPNLPDSDFKIR
jgi:outer membrane lipoprotein-sorting protein